MPLIKAIHSESFASSNAEYAELLQSTGKKHTIYQIGRVVSSPGGGDLYSASIECTFGTLKYGNLLAEVEHVDQAGLLLPLSSLPKGTLRGYASHYQRVTRVFDIRTTDGVDAFFKYAADNGIIFGADHLPGHLREDIIGSEAYARVFELIGIPKPEEPNLDRILQNIPSYTVEHNEIPAQKSFLSRLFSSRVIKKLNRRKQ